MIRRLGWVRLAPFLLFGIAIWVAREAQIEVWIQFQRAKESWRKGETDQALALFSSIRRRYPDSHYAPEALWEIASIQSLQTATLGDAAHSFGMLADDFPNHPLAPEARFRQAEICEQHLNDLVQAAQIWQLLLQTEEMPQPLRERALFRTANSYFKMNEFSTAWELLRPSVERFQDQTVAQQSRLLLGTIAQIEGRFDEAVQIFQAVVRVQECSACRVQGYLGLVQCYEFLNELPKAIEAANLIPVEHYSAEMKSELIQRLQNKLRYNQP